MEKEANRPWNFHSCKECPYRSKSAFVIYKHARLHGRRSNTDTFDCNSKTPEMYDCGLCEFETDLKVTCSGHFRVHHEKREANGMLDKILQCYKCKNCNFQTHSMLVLTKHVDSCNSEITHSSRDPDSFIAKKAEPARDISDQWYEFRSEGAKQWNYYKCKQCSFQCTLLNNIKKHVKAAKHLDPDGPQFKCKYCIIKTRNKRDLDKHVSEEHDIADNWFECGQCSFIAASKLKLNSHILRKHGCFKCEQCCFKSAYAKDVENHTLSVHTNLKGYFKCSLCPFLTKRRTGLQLHAKHMHTDPAKINWFKCMHCEHKTKKKYALRTHLLSRHGILS